MSGGATVQQDPERSWQRRRRIHAWRCLSPGCLEARSPHIGHLGRKSVSLEGRLQTGRGLGWPPTHVRAWQPSTSLDECTQVPSHPLGGRPENARPDIARAVIGRRLPYARQIKPCDCPATLLSLAEMHIAAMQQIPICHQTTCLRFT